MRAHLSVVTNQGFVGMPPCTPCASVTARKCPTQCAPASCTCTFVTCACAMRSGRGLHETKGARIPRLRMLVRREERVRHVPGPAVRRQLREGSVADETKRLRPTQRSAGSVVGQDDLRLGGLRRIFRYVDLA